MNRNYFKILIGFACVIVVSVSLGIYFKSIESEEIASKKLEFLDVFLDNSEVSAIYDDGRKLWIGGRDGLLLLDRVSGEILDKDLPNLDLTYAGDIVASDDGVVWIGHNNGLSGFSKDLEELYLFDLPDGFEGRINDIFVDGERLLVGGQGGLLVLENKEGKWGIVDYLTNEGALTGKVVNVVEKVYDNTYFYGSYLAKEEGGLSIYDEKSDSWEYFSVEEGLPHKYINAVLDLGDKGVLVATGHMDRGGLALLKRRGASYFCERTWGVENGLPGEKIRWLYLDDESRLWITTESDGLLILKDLDDLKNENLDGLYLSKESGLSDNEIKVIEETDRYIWLGGRYGLTRVEKKSLEKIY